MDWSAAPITAQEIHVEADKPSESNFKSGLDVAFSPYVPRRKDIKLVENKQLVPPSFHSAPSSGENLYSKDKNEEWRSVSNSVKKKRAPEIKTLLKVNQPNDTPDSESSVTVSNRNKTKIIKTKNTNISKFKPRAIKTSVVTITGKPGGATYAEILSKAKQNVSLASLGIQDLRMRRAMNGALVMELPGPKGKRLAGSLRNTRMCSRTML